MLKVSLVPRLTHEPGNEANLKVFHEECHTMPPPPLPQIPSIDQLEIHFAMDSNLLHKESDEAARQLAKQEGQGEDGRE